MRLRNIPRAESVLAASPRVLKDPEQFRGAFRQTVFQNTDPLHIEIGMGKGQFLLTLALQNPSVNYIGIERYSSVLLRPVEKLASMQAAGEAVPSNLRFICMDAADISQVFAPGEVDRIYLNFSDPWPKARATPDAASPPWNIWLVTMRSSPPTGRWNSRPTTGPSSTSPWSRLRLPLSGPLPPAPLISTMIRL